MNLLLAALLLVSPQDPDAQALSNLVDHPDEAKAKNLPPFYRQALDSELKAKRELGTLFATPTKIQLSGKARLFEDYVKELNRLTGWKLSHVDQGQEKKSFDFEGNGTPMEVAALLGEKAQMRYTFEWAWTGGYVSAFSNAPQPGMKVPEYRWFFYRDFAVQGAAGGWRKLIDFSGRPTWSTSVGFLVMTDPSLRALRCLDPRLIEALDEKGRPIPEVRFDNGALPEDTSDGVWRPPMSFGFGLAAEGLTKISRLRLSFRVQFPTEVRHYVITRFDPASPEKIRDDYFDIEVSVEDGSDGQMEGVLARVVPRKVRHADLSGIPFMMNHEFDKPGPGGMGAFFTGKGEGTQVRSWWCTVRPAETIKLEGSGRTEIRRPVRFELVIPVGIRERTIYAEFRDIPLR